MALLNELQLRTESIIRKRINNTTYLLWANEALEQLSEIAKVEDDPLEFTITGDAYEYIILEDGTHLHRTLVSTYSTETTVYYDSVYNEIEITDTWLATHTTSTQEVVIGDITYTYMIFDAVTSAGELFAIKRVFGADASAYNYTYTDGTEYTDLVTTEDIAQTLAITDNSIQLPTNFQQIIKVVGVANSYAYYFRERGFGNEEITTENDYPNATLSNQTNLFYVSLEESKMIFKSSLLDNSSLEMTISFYSHLPQYDIVEDLANWDSLVVPIEPTYHNLINYYCIYKYNESWKDNQAANDYFTKYLKLREEYRDSVDRKHQENMGTVAPKAVSFT